MTERRIYLRPYSVALSSSAGSGKTHALTTRLIAMLLQGTSLSEIVAITFTNLAAKEIRTRLFERVSRIAGGAGDEAALFASILGEPEGSVMKRAKKLKIELIRKFSLIQISTIHSFFASIIDCFPAETGVMNQAVIIDEHTRAQMLRESIEHYYRGIENSPGEMERIVQFMILFKRSGLRSATALEDIYANVDKKKYVLAHLLQKAERPSEVKMEFLRQRDVFFSEVLRRKIGFLVGTISDYLKSCGANRNLDRFRSGLEDFMESRNILDLASLTPFKRDPSNTVGYIDKLVASLTNELSARFNGALLSVRNALQSYFASQMRYYVMTWVDIYRRIDAIFTGMKKDAGCIDFHDIDEHARVFLGQLEDFEYLYFRAGSRIRSMLIDEFQDTSELQWDALQHLVREGLKRNGSLFYVGDNKQAIYRWRGGEPDLFERVSDRLGLERYRLPFSFRQNRVLLDYVNAVFKNVQKELFPSFHYEEQKPPPLRTQRENGYVAVLQCEDREAAMEELVRQIKDLQTRGVRLDDIAVLCRKNSEIVELENSFMNLNIPCRTAGRSKLMADYCIMDVRNIIHCVLNPDEPVYLAGLLRSPLLRISYEPLQQRKDDLSFSLLRVLEPELHEKMKRLTHLAGYLPPSGFIGQIYEEFDLLNVYGHKREVLLGFYELAYTFENTAAAVSIKDFDRFLTERQDSIFLQIGEQHGVSLFTIHASKGLEFHTVVVPFLSQPFRFRLDGSILYGRDNRGAITHYGIARSVYRDYLSDAAAMNKLIESTDDNYRVDELNALYVALTRARENLILIPVNSSKSQKKGILRTIGDVLISASEGDGDRRDLLRTFYGAPVPSDTQRGRTGAKKMVPLRIREKVPPAPQPVSAGPDGILDGEHPQDLRSQRVSLLKGLLFHRAVENIFRLPVSPAEIERLLHMAVSAEGADFSAGERKDALSQARPSLANVVSDPRLSIYFSETSYSEFHALSRKYRNFVGRIDRIVFGSTVDILDFKTNRVAKNGSIQRFSEVYRDQVEGYCAALRDISPEREVRGWLYFTDAAYDERVVRVC
jgi:ATP-dependent exoDNAse (exonuclease V) beta subunit